MKTRILLILTASVILIVSTFSFASSTGIRSTIQLTNNPYNDASPQINSKGDVVWFSYDGNDYEILLYNGASGTTLQFTNNDSGERSPQINSKGDVVWQGY